MSRPELPPEVRRFILTSVPSVPYLEALLLLRAEPAREWAVPDVARRLYLTEPRVAELLQALAEAGVAQPAAAGFRYAPAQELRGLLDSVAAHYAADIVGVSDLIHSRAGKKAQQFADAFRWRKDS